MTFNVKIFQTFEGVVQIDASNPEQAQTIADRLYNQEGRELPDMTEAGPLQFRVLRDPIEKVKIVAEQELAAKNSDEPSMEEVKQYLIRQGHPNPKEDGTLYEFTGEECHEMYSEAVRNDYDLCDVDRWFHLVRILDAPISFRLAMLIENALWQEDNEALEVVHPKDLLKGLCKTTLQQLVSDFSSDIIPPEAQAYWDERGVGRQDAELIATVLPTLAPSQKSLWPHRSPMLPLRTPPVARRAPTPPSRLQLTADYII